MSSAGLGPQSDCLQTHPLVKEGATTKNLQLSDRKQVGHVLQMRARHQDRLAD
jgi:hypothetical protein